MKKTLILLTIAAFAFASCGKKENPEDYKEVVQDLENVEQDLNESIKKLEEEESDMEHDVDSLLDGI